VGRFWFLLLLLTIYVAELVAIDKLHEEMSTKYAQFESTKEILSKCHLYVICEPCIMCADALKKMDVKTIVFGCSNDKFGGCGSVLFVDPKATLRNGCFKVQAIDLFRRFYNRDNPLSKEKLAQQQQ